MQEKIRIIDVGCAPAGDDPYAPLIGMAEVIGFDAMYGRTIGDGSTRTLHVTKHAIQASLFRPNFDVLSRFQGLAPLFEVMSTWDVKTERLDDIPECRGADYLKLDVQGAECLVLAGATETLKSVLVVHAEVSYLPFYYGQAMLGDVDEALRYAGFLYHLSPGIAQRAMVGVPEGGNGKQFLYGDVVYLRDFTKWPGSLTAEQGRKASEILTRCYDSVEMAAWAREVAHA